MTVARKTLFALIPLLSLAVCLVAVDLPLFSIGPGPAREVVPRIRLTGVPTYAPRGKLLLTTVRIRNLNVFDAIDAWLDDGRQVVPENEVLERGETGREYRRAARSQMDESKIAAAAFAFEKLTSYPRRHGRGVLVQEVVEGAPADGVLAPGDRIVQMDGRMIEKISDVAAVIKAAGTRRPVHVRVDVDGRTHEFSLRPVLLPEENRPIIGVVLVESFPFGVRIESADVGGPSAGLMLALGIVDLLSPGDLTSGRTVAGTGAIDLEGQVYPIGGVALKIRAAEAAGAELFIVPRDNEAEARAAKPRIPLVVVGSIDDALRHLEREAA